MDAPRLPLKLLAPERSDLFNRSSTIARGVEVAMIYKTGSEMNAEAVLLKQNGGLSRLAPA